MKSKKLSQEAKMYGKMRRSKMNPRYPDGTLRTQASLDLAEVSFAVEQQRLLDEGYTPSRDWEDKVLKIDYYDSDGNARQHKRVTNPRYGLSIAGIGSLEELDNTIADDLLFDVSYSDGDVYQPLYSGIPGHVVKTSARHESTEFSSNYNGEGPYVVIKAKALPRKYRV
jgi:hypothetical protein